MKRLLILAIALLQGTIIFAQKAESFIHQGNKLYSEQNYKAAEVKYLKSVEKKEASVEGNFNLGDAFYKQKKFEEAGQQFTSLAETARDETVRAKALHNLGNTLLQSKKLEEGIAAYKKSLIANPKDDQTRYNLAYAQEMLKKQQEKDQQKNKDNKDQKKDQDQKNKDKGDPDKKNPNKPDKPDQQKDEDKKKQDQPNKEKEQGQQPEANKLSKEDAERLLEALNNNEQQTQDKLKNQKLKGVKKSIEKDW
ncbi:MAG: tetratricopeptide repeat protein [Sphingobacteriaceae bacterium]